jgi:hypothetical protein
MTRVLRNKYPGTWDKGGGWRRLMIWKKREAVFTYLSWGPCGGIPRRRGERKTGVSRAGARGKAFPRLIIFLIDEQMFILKY